jgi:hypothetical protein
LNVWSPTGVHPVKLPVSKLPLIKMLAACAGLTDPTTNASTATPTASLFTTERAEIESAALTLFLVIISTT